MVTKNKIKTKDKLIGAVGELIAESGFSSVGVNAIARRAGVDKVLIYRYFGDLNGLYEAYAKSSDFWPSIDELVDESMLEGASLNCGEREAQSRQMLAEFFTRYLSALRSRPHTIEILAWETIERNALTVALENVREEFAMATLEKFSHLKLPDADWLAITNLFTGSIHYFALRARKISNFSGMDIQQDEFWDRLAQTIEFLIFQVQENT